MRGFFRCACFKWGQQRYYLVYSRQIEYYSSRMPRLARTVTKGYPYHEIQRGKYQQVIFESAQDFIQYQNCMIYFKAEVLRILDEQIKVLV
jgi:hypothetical protein